MNTLHLLLPDFSLILCGYLLCRWTSLDRKVWQPVESLVYFVLFPALLFHSIVRSPLNVAAASNLVAAGLCLAAASIGLAYSLPWWPGIGRQLNRRDHAAAAQIGFRFNSFIGLALADRLAGPHGVQLLAVLIGFCVPIFNVAAVWPMARQGGHGLARELSRNPLILATMGGLAANLTGFRMPELLEPTLARIGNASLALGLMAAGAGMQLGALWQGKALGGSVLAIRHLLLPALAAGLVSMFRLSPEEALVLVAFASLPTASSCYVLATRMGYNGAYVAGLVTLSTLLGLASIPLGLSLLQQ